MPRNVWSVVLSGMEQRIGLFTFVVPEEKSKIKEERIQFSGTHAIVALQCVRPICSHFPLFQAFFILGIALAILGVFLVQWGKASDVNPEDGTTIRQPSSHSQKDLEAQKEISQPSKALTELSEQYNPSGAYPQTVTENEHSFNGTAKTVPTDNLGPYFPPPCALSEKQPFSKPLVNGVVGKQAQNTLMVMDMEPAVPVAEVVAPGSRDGDGDGAPRKRLGTLRPLPQKSSPLSKHNKVAHAIGEDHSCLGDGERTANGEDHHAHHHQNGNGTNAVSK